LARAVARLEKRGIFARSSQAVIWPWQIELQKPRSIMRATIPTEEATDAKGDGLISGPVRQ